MKKDKKTISLDDSIKRFVGEDKNREKMINEVYEDMKLEIILEQLRQIRRKKGITLKVLAELMNTSESALSRLERQSKNVTIFTLAKYAKILGKKIEIKMV